MQELAEDLKRAIAQQHHEYVSEYLSLVKSSLLDSLNLDPLLDQ